MLAFSRQALNMIEQEITLKNGQLKGVSAAVTVLAAGLFAAAASPAGGQARPQGCIIEQWPAYFAPGPQSFTVRERIPVAGGTIHAIAFGAPEGEYAKLYLFFLDRDGCERKALVVGTYAYLNDFARERGELGEGERLWHLDYLDAETQRTLEYLYEKPAYEEMRARALELLQ